MKGFLEGGVEPNCETGNLDYARAGMQGEGVLNPHPRD